MQKNDDIYDIDIDIDDILLISSLPQSDLDKFLIAYTSFHPSFTYTFETFNICAHFLDIEIKITGGKFTTSLYTKPTDSKNYLLYNSSHPKATLNSIAYSQFLRIKRICSLHSDFVLESDKLFSTFRLIEDCGYPNHILEKAYDSVCRKDRNELINSAHIKPPLDRFPLVLPFHLYTKQISDDITRLCNLFRSKNSTILEILPSPPLKAFCRARNIKSLLVKTTLRPFTPNAIPSIPGNFLCQRNRCSTCPHIANISFIRGPSGFFSIRGTFTCKSCCLIYAITCKRCPSIYIGQTKRPLFTRFSEHLRSIRNQNTPLGSHFSLPNYSQSDMLVSALIFAPIIEEKRLELKSNIIVNLGCDAPPGLNSGVCFSQHT